MNCRGTRLTEAFVDGPHCSGNKISGNTPDLRQLVEAQQKKCRHQHGGVLKQAVRMDVVSPRKEVVEERAHVTELWRSTWQQDLAIFRQLRFVGTLRLLNIIAVILIARKGGLTRSGRASGPSPLTVQLVEKDGHLRRNVIRSRQGQLPLPHACVEEVGNVGRSGRVNLVGIDADFLAES